MQYLSEYIVYEFLIDRGIVYKNGEFLDPNRYFDEYGKITIIVRSLLEGFLRWYNNCWKNSLQLNYEKTFKRSFKIFFWILNGLR